MNEYFNSIKVQLELEGAERIDLNKVISIP